jgi:HemY protein
MIKVILYVLIILVGLCISPFIVGNTGYIYIGAGDYQIETSIVFAVVAIIIFYSLLQLAEWILIGGGKLILSSRYLPQRWRTNVARKSTLNGALALAEEDWPSAEKALAKGAARGELPTLNLLAAARAAQHQNKVQARDNYLAMAEKEPLAIGAVNAARIRYWLQQGELEQARTALDKLAPNARSKLPLLRLALELYQAQEDWQALKLLLPAAKKHQLLTPDALQALAQETNIALLRTAGATSEQELDKWWHLLTRDERNHSETLTVYALGLCRYERKAEALKLLMKRCKSEPSSDIFAALPLVVSAEDLEVRKQLQNVEHLMADDADYQVCLAKLCLQSRDFKQAKVHWQHACQLRPDRASWFALGQLQEQLGEQFNAIQSYRNAAQL